MTHVCDEIESLADEGTTASDKEIGDAMRQLYTLSKEKYRHRLYRPTSGTEAEKWHKKRAEKFEAELSRLHSQIDCMLRSRSLDPVTDDRHVRHFAPELLADKPHRHMSRDADPAGPDPLMQIALERGHVPETARELSRESQIPVGVARQ